MHTLGPIFFIFMQFFGKFWANNLCPLWEILDLPWYYIIGGFTVKAALGLISTVVLITIISQWHIIQQVLGDVGWKFDLRNLVKQMFLWIHLVADAFLLLLCIDASNRVVMADADNLEKSTGSSIFSPAANKTLMSLSSSVLCRYYKSSYTLMSAKSCEEQCHHHCSQQTSSWSN